MKDTLTDYRARHFLWTVQNRIGWITLNGPEKKNPLTFERYAELRDLMRRLPQAPEVRVIVISGADANFCSGGDVQEIIGPLTRMSMPELLNFTRMTGDLGHVLRHPLKHASFENRVLVHPGGARGLRHGRLRDFAAHHRPRTRRGIALVRPQHGGR